ncbi:MAG: UDP-N-acetylmuramate dehydrogenase [Bacilli bacterium]|nr:UDP-N-acetylmuramate dehydrogenase [Bacilli bacterium]
MDQYIDTIKELNIGKVEEYASLKKYTTYRVGGTARAIVFPQNIDGLVTLVRFLRENDILYKLLGKGSNLLFSEKNYNGILIKLDEFNDITFFGKDKVRVGAGVSLIKLSLMAAKKGLTGLEFASGIPGSIGGSVFMNAGAYKSDMGYIVESVKVLTPELRIITLENREMEFHYRSSYLQKHRDYICLEAVLRLQKGKREAIEEVIRERKQRRMESQPLEYPSAGSVFRNPEDNFAGKLIEDVGLKGKIYGGAMVSDKHANFIVNHNGASADDVKYLIDLCHDKVLEEYGIDMRIEQEFVNWE